ncbi:MFS transporter [Candidatus Parcubacteria bacterium]|nr:MFS transporter [Candidatus Parcubacteria bacterium]
MFNSYFDNNFSDGFWALFGAKTVIMIATGFLGIFLPIFLFNLFDGNIQKVALYFGCSSLIYIFTVPLGAQFLNDFGFRNALRLSVFWGALFYVIFYFIDKQNSFYLIPLSILATVLFRLFYWTPYHTDFAKFTDNSKRGKQLSFFNVAGNITAGLIPLLSGFLIAQFGFDLVFIIAIILYLVSGLFYFKIPRTEEKFSWSYSETWKKFFDKKNRPAVLAFTADGVEAIISVTVWPIFIFQLLKGNYFEVGYLSALIIVVTIILQFITGNLLDNGKKEKLLGLGTLFYSLGWIIKIFILTSFHIFVAGLYHNVAKIFSRTSFDVMTYDMAEHQGHYVDEFTVLHEIAFHIGKVLSVIFVILISFVLPLQWTFILAAGASFLMNILRKEGQMEM